MRRPEARRVRCGLRWLWLSRAERGRIHAESADLSRGPVLFGRGNRVDTVTRACLIDARRQLGRRTSLGDHGDRARSWKATACPRILEIEAANHQSQDVFVAVRNTGPVCPSRITIACSTPFVRRRRMPWGWGAVAPRERRDRVGFGEGLDYPRSRVSDTRYTPAMGNSAASAPLSTTDAGSFSAQKRSAARWFWYYTCPIGARGSSLRALHGFRRSPCNEMRHALMSRTRRETHGSHIVADDHHYRAAVG